MNKFIITLISLIVCSHLGYAQSDEREVVGVAKFTCETDDRFTGLVTEKIVEVLTNSKRFQVVDRTSYDKVHEELEFQKSEAFIDSENTAEQGVAVAAESLVTGHIIKIPVYAIKNANGSIKGYKASVAFQMKIVDVETGLSTEATSFQGKASDLMMSPESAVTEAMKSLQPELEEYFRINFPIKCKIVKVLSTKKDNADIVLVNAGSEQGLKEGHELTVSFIEMLEGKPYPSQIAELKVVKVAGTSFSECKVLGKGRKELLSRFNAGEKLECKLIIEK